MNHESKLTQGSLTTGTTVNGPYTMHTMDNGLRIVIENMPHVRSAAAGFLVLTGARDEVRDVAGVSHFLEHMMFKGTAKRTWRDITLTFDRMGSSYNAYTSEDRTMYYGWVRSRDIVNQMELLADMLRSTLPNEEFQTERGVILEEIAMAKDQLEHLAFDFIQEKIFVGHPLAWPILGYEETVRNLTRDQMYEYFEKRYAPDNMILVIAGAVDPGEMIEAAQRLCGHWKRSNGAHPRTPPKIQGGSDSLQVERFKQQIVALTFPSVSAADSRSETSSAAATILGGDNSRFFWNIVQTGLSPRAGVSHLGYTDTGLMILFAAGQPENIDALHEAMRKEAKKICKEGVKKEEVDRVKTRRRTGLAIESEAPYYRLSQLMDDMEYRGAPRTVDEMLADVDAVSIDTIRDYFREFPIHTGGHLASVGPRAWPNGR
ncbi:MAG: pitrilysin family protein [Planctomycetota bacterium]